MKIYTSEFRRSVVVDFNELSQSWEGFKPLSSCKRQGLEQFQFSLFVFSLISLFLSLSISRRKPLPFVEKEFVHYYILSSSCWPFIFSCGFIAFVFCCSWANLFHSNHLAPLLNLFNSRPFYTWREAAKALLWILSLLLNTLRKSTITTLKNSSWIELLLTTKAICLFPVFWAQTAVCWMVRCWIIEALKSSKAAKWPGSPAYSFFDRQGVLLHWPVCLGTKVNSSYYQIHLSLRPTIRA